MKRFLSKVLKISLGVYSALFVVFFFDLDGKLIKYLVEPIFLKHYDDMPRRDVTKDEYLIGKFDNFDKDT
jgi:hypothetical protein